MLTITNKIVRCRLGRCRLSARLATISFISVAIGWNSATSAQTPPEVDQSIAQRITRSAQAKTNATAARNASTPSSLQEISDSNPKSVYVAVSQAEVYSGPSTEHYPTGRVERGMALEAYHRTEDGWLGIRPPDGSFSWVPASDAYLLPGGRVIEITSQHAVSWIGSSLGSAKQYRWQVELRPGEQLAVLGEMTNKSDEDKESLWYKIGPPAGEFRWIHEKAISLTAVAPATRQVTLPMKSKVQSASNSTPDKENKVQPAQFSEDVFVEGVVDGYSSDAGMIYGDGSTSGEYVMEGDYYDGEFIVGGAHDGEFSIDNSDVIYEDSGTSAPSRGGWDGWHAMELTDEGFRIPFLERRYQQAQARSAVDPLNHDPFSLSMPGKIQEPRSIRQDVREDVGVSPVRRFTPWRDPRELRSNRMQYGAGNSLSAKSINDRPTSQIAQRETGSEERHDDAPQLKDNNTAAGDLLGRLVSAVKESSSNAEQSAASAPKTPSPIDERNWYGIDRTAQVDNSQGVNALELAQLQLVLSEMVAQPMNAWNLQPIMDRVKYFIEHGATAIERGQARLMLERIEDFDQLAKKSGFGGLGPVLTASASVASTAAPNSSITAAGYESAMPDGQQSSYDATGWLVPVRAATAGQPTHAITNDAGQVIAYVTGLPGMNLDLYINQPVGIAGLRGYLPQLQSQHIQAQRIVRLR